MSDGLGITILVILIILIILVPSFMFDIISRVCSYGKAVSLWNRELQSL